MLVGLSREDFLTGLYELSGGLRFRCMDLFDVRGSRFLLDSGAKTLETLRIHPTRWTGKGVLDGPGPHFSDPSTHRISRVHTPDI